MAAILESKAYFTSRLAALDLKEFAPKFIEKDWTTLSAFAFSVNYVPGRSDETVMVEKVYKVLLGQADHKKEHAVRRLFFEAHAMAQADLTRRIANPDEEGKAPRKLPIEERGERWRLIMTELPNLNLRGDLEPSQALVDKFVEMEELNQLRFLKWDEYTKRDQENKGVKKVPMWAEENGQLCRVYKDEELVYHPHDRLELKYTLQRRGIAMHMAHLVSFACHEKLVDYYFEEMSRDPVDTTRYERISVDQVMNTDKEIFIRMGEESRDGFRILGNIPSGTFPLDAIMTKVMAHPRVIQLLLPLPMSRGSSQGTSQRQESRNKRDHTETVQVQQLKAENKKLRTNKQGGKDKTKGSSVGGKGKSKGKDKSGRTARLPKELLGMNYEVGGKRLCYAYNMRSGCNVSGEDKCDKGHHLCCFPGCGAEHSLQSCPDYAKAVMKKKGY